MTRAYVLDPTTHAVLGLVDQSWEKLKYTRRYWGMDTFEMSIQRARLWASELQTGRLLYLPDEGDRIFLIEQVQSLAEGSSSNDKMTVTGRSLEGIGMAERLVIPPAGQDYDKQTAQPAETAMKHYVSDHASEAALTVARRVPSLHVVPSAGSGANVTVSGRYQTVFDLVKQIGLLSGIGWEVTYNASTGKYDWDVIVGVDRHASVFFDFAFETLEKWEELDSVLDSKTVAVVAGQGEGKDRDVVTRWSGSEPTGFDRREAFVDARDIDLGATTELQARGDSVLAATQGQTRLEAGIHQYGSFKYGIHWDMGDLVLIRNEARGISYTARVVEVEKAFDKSSAAPTVTAVIDRPFPTIQDAVKGSSAAPGAVDYPDTLNPKVDSIILDRLNADVTLSRASAGLLNVASALRLAGGPVLRKGALSRELQLDTDGASAAARFSIIGTTTQEASLQVLDADDTTAKVVISGGGNASNGIISFGDGTNQDVNLYRAGADILRSDDAIRSRRAATTDEAFGAHESASTTLRFRLQADGKMEWAATSSSADTNLYRAAANRLATDDEFNVGNPNTAAGSGVLARTTGSLELVANATTPYLDFKDDATQDFDARIIYNLAADGFLRFDGADVMVTNDLGFAGSAGAHGSSTSFAINNGGTATFGSKSLTWYKIGRIVVFTMSFSVTANGSGSSTVTITSTGLPGGTNTAAIWGDRGGTGVVPITGRFAGGSEFTCSRILTTPSNGTVTGADLVSGAAYTFIGCYIASS